MREEIMTIKCETVEKVVRQLAECTHVIKRTLDECEYKDYVIRQLNSTIAKLREAHTHFICEQGIADGDAAIEAIINTWLEKTEELRDDVKEESA